MRTCGMLGFDPCRKHPPVLVGGALQLKCTKGLTHAYLAGLSPAESAVPRLQPF